MSDTRAQLVHIAVDRRLGHEWDEWDGKPLPRGGDFSAPPALFFGFAALTLGLGAGLIGVLVFLVAPRITFIWSGLPAALYLVTGALTLLAFLWLAVLALSTLMRRPLLPDWLAERGPFLRLMSLTSRVARFFGRRDWVENAAVKIYNNLAEHRSHRVNGNELLVLIPRCLSKKTLDGVLDVASRNSVPVFVATRGQLARRAIKERRPRAVVAVACERDMVTGLRDVAGHVPVLGLTMQLPAGPCKDAVVDLEQMDRWVRHYLS